MDDSRCGIGGAGERAGHEGPVMPCPYVGLRGDRRIWTGRPRQCAVSPSLLGAVPAESSASWASTALWTLPWTWLASIRSMVPSASGTARTPGLDPREAQGNTLDLGEIADLAQLRRPWESIHRTLSMPRQRPDPAIVRQGPAATGGMSARSLAGGPRQPAAWRTRSRMRASTSGVISRIANDVAHIGPSSSFASGWKPNVAYRTLNFPASWKKQIDLPPLK